MYSEEFLACAVLPSQPQQTPSSLTTAADVQVYSFGEQIIVTRLMLQVTTATVGAAVVSVYQRPTFGSSTGQVLIGTLTIPAGAAVGALYYKNVESVKIPQGTQLAFTVTTAASTGAGYPMFKGFMAVEDPRNVSAMIASA